MPSALILSAILQELVSQYISLIFSSVSATWPLQDKYNKFLLTHSVSTAYSCTVPLKSRPNISTLLESPLLLAECRDRESPALLQEIDSSTPTFQCFLSTEREQENSTCVTKSGETWRWVASLLYEHQSSQCCIKEMGQEEIQVPEALQIPHPTTPTCAGLYMCVSEIRTETAASTLAFCPCLMSKSWFFQPLFLSDGFGSCASCHHSVQQVLFNQPPDFKCG